MTIGAAIAEPIKVHGLYKGKATIEARVIELLIDCGLSIDDRIKY
jgi:ABC-type microcin C transport system duplicated ATPase subunit YejF